MKVATNRLFSEEANNQLEAEQLGLKLLGIVCPLIELIALKYTFRTLFVKNLYFFR